MKLAIFTLTFIALSGCSDRRDVSTPAEALIGRWGGDKSSGIYYFAPDGQYWISGKTEDGFFSYTETYSIIDQDPQNRSIKFEMWGKPIGSGRITMRKRKKTKSIVEGKFSEDYKSFSGGRNTATYPRDNTLDGRWYSEFKMEYRGPNPLPSPEP